MLVFKCVFIGQLNQQKRQLKIYLEFRYIDELYNDNDGVSQVRSRTKITIDRKIGKSE